MSGLTVILAFVAVLILFEEIVPRIRFHLWKRRQDAQQAEWERRAAKVEREMAELSAKAAELPARVAPWEACRADSEARAAGPDTPVWKLRLVERAKKGDATAMANLGNTAFKHKQFVEAYFWKWRMQEEKKILVTNPSLREIRRAWRKKGCPAERENVYWGFDANQAAAIRAFMRLKCGIDADAARERIEALAEQGLEEAKRMKPSVRPCHFHGGMLKCQKIAKEG